MADQLKTSSDIGIGAGEAQQLEGPSTSLLGNAENHLRRHLSRTITQPLGLYESTIDLYGPITDSDVLQAEASLVDEAYRILHGSCSSDTETCSSHEDGQDSAHDPKDRKDHTVQNSRSRRKHEARNRSDEGWAKSILERRTGWVKKQRNQVAEYTAQLEAHADELQLEVSNLSPKVISLQNHQWILKEENDTLKQKLADLSRYQRFKGDENSALENELELLRIHGGHRLEQAERQEPHEVPSSIEDPDGEGGAKVELTIIEQRARLKPWQKQKTKKRLEILTHVPKETSAEQENASSLGSSPNFPKEPLAEGKESRQLSLVKWPSSLYHSISAIEKDVLEVATEEPAEINVRKGNVDSTSGNPPNCPSDV